MKKTIDELKETARLIRCDIVQMIGQGKAGHLGGSCSIADLVAALYFYKMRLDPERPGWDDRDRFILSKGHSVPAQYSALSRLGFFPRKELGRLKKLGAILQGHPDMHKTPGIEANTGSLGQGLSIACGIAAAAKLDNKDYSVYCITGDGEMGEGQIWEAAMAASCYRLDNLTAILDRNGLQAMGPTCKRLDTSPLEDKWRAFGWHVMVIDGHNMEQIVSALDKADDVEGCPCMIIADTVKGKGVSFAENNAAFHNCVMTGEQYNRACRDLGIEREVL